MTNKKPTLKSDKKIEDKKPVTTSTSVDKKEVEVQKEEKLVSSKHANENKAPKSAVNKIHNVKKVNLYVKLYNTLRINIFTYIYILYFK